MTEIEKIAAAFRSDHDISQSAIPPVDNCLEQRKTRSMAGLLCWSCDWNL